MIRPILAIYWKDLRALLVSPSFYFLIGLCAVLWSLFFGLSVLNFSQQSYQMSVKGIDSGLNIHQDLIANYALIVKYTLIFVLIGFSVRFFVDEKKQKTMPLLLSSPVSSWQIVCAKVMFGKSVVILSLVFSAILPLSLSWFIDLPLSLFLATYLGVYLLLMLYLSLAMLASSLTESTVVCVVLSLLFILSVQLIGAGSLFTESQFLKSLFGYLSLDAHFKAFRVGVLNLASLAYLGSAIGFFLFLTERSFESNRWQ